MSTSRPIRALWIENAKLAQRPPFRHGRPLWFAQIHAINEIKSQFRKYQNMRYVSFSHRGLRSFGYVTSEGVVDLRDSERGPQTLRDFIAAGQSGDQPPQLGQKLLWGDITLLPPIPDPGKIVCVAVNYASGSTAAPKAEHPLLFLRVAASQVGHQGPLVIPQESDRLDFEGELAVIIGTPGRRIPKDSALRHVAGYSCYNDGSVRDWQKHSSQFTAGKNFYSTGAFGPWLVTPDEIGPLSDIKLETRVNGVVKQTASVGDMIFPIPELIAYISTFVPLEAGDVIVSGTPTGFGTTRTPPEFLKHGDQVEVEITRVGLLSNQVIAEQATHNFDNVSFVEIPLLLLRD